jgi:hypothetical protein
MPDNIISLLNMKNATVKRLVINIIYLMFVRDYHHAEQRNELIELLNGKQVAPYIY